MLLIRAQRDAASLTSLAREEVRAIDPDLPLFGILTSVGAGVAGRGSA